MSYIQDLQYVIELARGAGKIVSQQYGQVKRLTKTHIAASAEAVTEADRTTQRHIVAGLRKKFPGDGIIGEENDRGDAITFDVSNPNGRNWVIDPIDGTNNFIAGLGMFAVCIGLLDAGQPVIGVVYDVTRDQLYSAARGGGAWLGEKRLQVVQSPLGDASLLMLTSNLLDKAGQCPGWATRWLGQTEWKIRVLGSAALEAIQVAAGIAHGAITINGKLWDVVAPAAILLEAGGVISDLAGKPIFPFRLESYQGAKVPFLAATPLTHDELLAEIRISS
ncbi:MAG TPA: inositol monophosphatase [Tepidisphaeraceae bacterium]|nr:inositol monophosphatase [Tepidisphaeraceae bacterium]